ncbi:UDP-N-acetylmuramoyl-L-alanine--D-glutamate ligase [Candidatus Parcubacteria bacterium]|nr:MAG: UDP-N-acetylmuramoyl-L-alanine--D-glutamate ligase [Candidatus Parcubacteria bacterium]
MNEILAKLNKKKIAILGLGIENLAMLEYFEKQGLEARIDIFDMRPEKELNGRIKNLEKNEKYKLIKQSDENNFSTYDIIFRSPGFPLFKENLVQAKEAGVIISSAMKLFFELCPSKNTIGVTGSKGKGTTSSLIANILEQAEIPVLLGGNIGVAPFSFIDEIREDSWVVLELSSFQLEDLENSPHIAVITNITEEHLRPADPMNPNYHKSIDDYARAKLTILRHQVKGDWAVINENLKDKAPFFYRGKENKLGNAKRIYFSKSEYSSKLIGAYNKENIGAATEVAKILKIKPSLTKKAVANFHGLPHRIEYVKEVAGVKYYDNSFATTPVATINDINCFVEPIILILGGADKGSSFKNLGKETAKKNVDSVILLLGEASPHINQELLSAGFPSHKIYKVKSMTEAVKKAQAISKAGFVVLLSTACASFGMFNNYKERGDKFQEEVKKL